MKRIAVIPGDGIGGEVTAEAVKVLEYLESRGLALRLHRFDFGAQRFLDTGESLPAGAMEELSSYDAILMGAFGDPRVPDMSHARDILLGLRQNLDLYVNERPAILLHERLCPLKARGPDSVHFVVLRENTEGEYIGAGGALRKGTRDEVALEASFSTRRGVERFLHHAFRTARARGFPSLVMVDKHNAQRFSGDLWQRVFLDVAREYGDIEARHLFVDTLCMELVLRPEQFGVIAAGNLFGDIISDVGAALIGGPGLAPSANYNPETGRGMFEPVHGSAPDLAGKGLANPIASVLSAAMMLDHVGYPALGTAIRGAVRAAIEEGETTLDLGGRLSTAAAGDAIVRRIGPVDCGEPAGNPLAGRS